MTLKVLVVDDHEAAREGVCYLLKGFGFCIADAVSRGRDVLSSMSSATADVILMDVRLPDSDGLATLEKVRARDEKFPVVIFSAYDNMTYIARAAALGASDYVIKGRAGHELKHCLERAVKREPPSPFGAMAKVMRIMREQVDTSLLPSGFPLTGREAQVLRHVALGLSNKEIARSLMISVETVKEHVQNILRKVNATDRTDAAVRAIQCGIVDP